jgi:hypothetical protein
MGVVLWNASVLEKIHMSVEQRGFQQTHCNVDEQNGNGNGNENGTERNGTYYNIDLPIQYQTRFISLSASSVVL